MQQAANRFDTQPATRRFDLYAFIHKAIRANLAQVMLGVGRMDCNDESEINATLSDVEGLLELCETHLANENRFVHPAMEARDPGSTRAIAGEHVEHLAAIDRLRCLAVALRGSTGMARHEAGDRLYRALALFAGENYEHMDYEQTEHNRVLWANYSDEELRGIEHAIVSSLPQDEVQYVLRWMLPHLNPAERAVLLGGLQREAPREVFGGVLDMLRPLLGRLEWRKLTLALGV